MENEKVKLNPSYYSITPASVRYSDKLSGHAKLMYGEITALCSKEGYCWASNAYFASLYKKDAGTISRWIQSLVKLGFIRYTLGKDNYRKIFIMDSHINAQTLSAKMPRGLGKNAEYSIKASIKSNTKDLGGKNPPNSLFSFEEEIKKLEDSDRRDLNIIALFMEYKAKELKPKIKNSTQLSFFIKRYLKIAGQLMKADYSDEQLIDAFDSVKRKFKDSNIDWTLETIGKELTK